MENKDKLGQSPAFPTDVLIETGLAHNIGMSKRFYAACAAMQGICSTLNYTQNVTLSLAQQIVKESYMVADELLKQEND